MNPLLREAARSVLAVVLTACVAGIGTACAQGDEPATVELRTTPTPAAVGESVPMSTQAVPVKRLQNLRLTGGLVDLPAMPQEMELMSDIVTDLLSGNVTKLLADNCTRLLSGNAPEVLSRIAAELLSGNEAELLSGNEAELLSENSAQLFSENEAELLSGNKVQLLSNINVNISITNSGNNNGGPPPAARQPLLQQKKPAQPGTLHPPGHATVQPQNYTTTKATKKARRARRRFEALDTNGDGVLTFEELQAHGTTDRTASTSDRSRP